MSSENMNEKNTVGKASRRSDSNNEPVGSAKHAKHAEKCTPPAWLTQESLHPLFEELKGLKASTLTAKALISLVSRFRGNLLALELLKDIVLSIAYRLAEDYEGFAVNDDACGKQSSPLLQHVFERLAENEFVRDPQHILPKGVSGKGWNTAMGELFYHHKCCTGMGFDSLSATVFCDLGRPLLVVKERREKTKQFDDILLAVPLLRRLWVAPFLSIASAPDDFDDIHAAYNAILKKYPALYRVMDPALVVVSGGAGALVADLAAVPVGPVAGGLAPCSLAAAPALHGLMTNVYNVANLAEARIMMAAMKARDPTYNLIGVSGPAGNFLSL